jgi:hypothetical protein
MNTIDGNVLWEWNLNNSFKQLVQLPGNLDSQLALLKTLTTLS